MRICEILGNRLFSTQNLTEGCNTSFVALTFLRGVDFEIAFLVDKIQHGQLKVKL